MRVLCISGAYGSAEKFRVQLAPIVEELEQDGTASFYFIDGPCKAVPPDGFARFFGAPPYFRFIEPDDPTAKVDENDMLMRIRDFPNCETPEETMRELLWGGGAESHKSIDNAMKFLINIMETKGPFDAVFGYSEGATVAATLLFHEQRRFETKGIQPMLKYALFFAGWPPMDPETHVMLLSDMTKMRIQIPTCHIIGSLDPYLHGSLALYNICNPRTAYLFDHGKGHTLPREKETVKEMGDVIRAAIATYGI